MKGSADRIAMCTTTYFDGVIAAIDPESSWVCRWQRTCTHTSAHTRHLICPKYSIAKYVRGMYAVRVKGRIPEDVEAELYSRGIKYRSRDQIDQD